ncbi:PEP-CTERM sorting domain-containing protein [Aquincola sp. S2]|uniref:PEP-CTERM sorting domain-containing protein n=1 Tax=Pseudaquabacterium terrae TaxID=2732868 RepID=A0ABX2EP99_9BURK|nr:DVUA0089 family protein [Aquabacterium terrae]NRF70314.1 PEP-CTERM sorting domain-containing protein [Aquabacterium terrae]
MKRTLRTALAAAAVAAGSVSAWAANVSFTGNLAGDNDVQTFSFTLATTADVTLRTWSYAGGINAAGDTIAAGGFDPIVSLFLGNGIGAILLTSNDDDPSVATDPATGSALDALLAVTGLPSGTYTVALSQFANFAIGPTLGDGFLGAGNTGFDGRSAAWALDILGVDAAVSVPEPSSLALALLALAAAAAGAAAGRPAGRRRTGLG